MSVDPSLTFAESHTIVDRARAALADHLPAHGGVTMPVCPRHEHEGQPANAAV
jgi:divalent metal cation (Fe/Co/Zn/Cd) transporter